MDHAAPGSRDAPRKGIAIVGRSPRERRGGGVVRCRSGDAGDGAVDGAVGLEACVGGLRGVCGRGEGGEGFAGAGGDDEDAAAALGEAVVCAVEEAPADAEAEGGEDLDDGVEVELVAAEEAGGLLEGHDAGFDLLEELHDGEEGGGVHVVVFAHDGVGVGEELAGGREVADVAFVVGCESGELVRPLVVDGGLREVEGVGVAGMLVEVEAPLNVQASHYGAA